MPAAPDSGRRPRRRWTVEFRAALASFVFLVTVVLLVLFVVRRDQQHVPLIHSMGMLRATIVIGLVIAIPIATYLLVRQWTTADRTPYRDLRSAWEAGLAALDSEGIDFGTTPVFLLFGFEGERAARSFAASTGLLFHVDGTPDRAAPLYWFANRDVIYLCCVEAGSLGAFTALVERAAQEAFSEESSVVAPNPGRATLNFEGPAWQPADEVPNPPPIRQSLRRTMHGPGDEQGAAGSDWGTAQLRDVRVGGGPMAGRRRSVSLPAQDELEQRQRLADLCRLIRVRRAPVCPVNGVVVVLPIDTITDDADEIEVLQRLLRRDLETVRDSLMLRAPTSVVVTNCDRVPGFRELMRRVGRERVATMRFGHRFDVRCRARQESLADFAEHLSGVFEDTVYSLFQQSDVLTRPGTARLHGLLCHVRSVMKERLATILAGGVGEERDGDDDQGVLFGGCYFCATGDRDDRRAFVRGLGDKLLTEQEDVEWTRAAIRGDRGLRTWTRAGFAITILLAILAIVQFVVHAAGWGG